MDTLFCGGGVTAVPGLLLKTCKFCSRFGEVELDEAVLDPPPCIELNI